MTVRRTWTIPDNATSDGQNPNIVKGRDESACLTQNPLGVAGVPGRPGDGLVGSTVGESFQAEPTCSPDDVEENDGDIFCGDIVNMADGRQLLAGGTEWYNEPAILQQGQGPPDRLRRARARGPAQRRGPSTGKTTAGTQRRR